ncbi:MAG: class I SAM-dependent methyltransferase [Ignavibacteriaceae bacterium]|nr:class I SAM-dependent methyltransferase [Ignavibacteriaceae bacterium]
MEVKSKSPAWLDPLHPNFKRWEKSRKLSLERGKFVRAVIEQKNKIKNLSIIDLGSGEGGTAKILAEANFVVSIDLSLIRLQRQNDSGFKFYKINGDAIHLPVKDELADLIIVQDVIEHLNDIKSFYEEIKRVIKPNGIIYLSTPNKLSFFNFISDPHFGLPVISVLKRATIKKYFLKYFRKNDFNRNDIAQLLSLKELTSLFCNDYYLELNTKFTVKELFNGNKGIVWSDIHLTLIAFCKFTGIDRIIKIIANDKQGIINKFITPTFYFTLKRKSKKYSLTLNSSHKLFQIIITSAAAFFLFQQNYLLLTDSNKFLS